MPVKSRLFMEELPIYRIHTTSKKGQAKVDVLCVQYNHSSTFGFVPGT